MECGLDFLAIAGGLSRTPIIKLPASEAPADPPSAPVITLAAVAEDGPGIIAFLLTTETARSSPMLNDIEFVQAFYIQKNENQNLNFKP